MNCGFIVGNVTKDVQLKTTSQGISVCTFDVAVNKRTKGGTKPEADFFRVTTWRGLAETCAKFLGKGRKVAVTGTMSASAYINKEGAAVASMEITADKVEFLTPKNEQPKQSGGFVEDDGGELPWG